MPFDRKHDPEQLYQLWLKWWRNGGTKGSRTAAAFADFSAVPQNTVNKRFPAWKRRAQAEGASLETLGNSNTHSNANADRLKSSAVASPPTEAATVGEAERVGSTREARPGSARAVMEELLASGDPSVRLRAAQALEKLDKEGQQEEATPYDDMPREALLDRLAALSEEPLRAEWEAQSGKAFLVGRVPALGGGNTLDADGRAQAGGQASTNAASAD